MVSRSRRRVVVAATMMTGTPAPTFSTHTRQVDLFTVPSRLVGGRDAVAAAAVQATSLFKRSGQKWKKDSPECLPCSDDVNIQVFEQLECSTFLGPTRSYRYTYVVAT